MCSYVVAGIYDTHIHLRCLRVHVGYSHAVFVCRGRLSSGLCEKSLKRLSIQRANQRAMIAVKKHRSARYTHTHTRISCLRILRKSHKTSIEFVWDSGGGAHVPGTRIQPVRDVRERFICIFLINCQRVHARETFHTHRARGTRAATEPVFNAIFIYKHTHTRNAESLLFFFLCSCPLAK